MTAWRPNVSTIRAYLDSGCSNEIHDVTYVDQSGSCSESCSGSTDGSHAFDEDATTSWRPQCGPKCNVGEAWVTFFTKTEVQCVSAANLGEGSGGGNPWNGGIKVELQNESSWDTIFESSAGNIAHSLIGISMSSYFSAPKMIRVKENQQVPLCLNFFIYRWFDSLRRRILWLEIIST